MLVEVELEVFIGKVDAELFKTVKFKVLEPKDVQHCNGGLSVSVAYDVVHPLHQPREETGVQGLGQGIPARAGRQQWQLKSNGHCARSAVEQLLWEGRTER